MKKTQYKYSITGSIDADEIIINVDESNDVVQETGEVYDDFYTRVSRLLTRIIEGRKHYPKIERLDD